MESDFILFDKMAIIGVGLIGGSLALKLKELKMVNTVIGFGRTEQNLIDAKKIGAIDEYYTDFSHLKDVDIVIVATPVSSIVHIAKQVAQFCRKDTIITDVGSVKEDIVQELERQHINFVGGHPIAGTENSGAKAAFSSLFVNRRCVLTPTKRTDQAALTQLKLMWESVGAKVIMMEPSLHDKIFAAISHLPHVIAYSLMKCADSMDDIDKNIMSYSAGGFLDFTRIASSDPEMWRDICIMNKSNIIEMIRRFEEELGEIKKAINASDGHRLYEDFYTSQQARDNLLELNKNE